MDGADPGSPSPLDEAALRYELDPELAYTVRPIGVLRSPFRVHAGTPRQPRVGTPAEGFVVVRHGLQNLLQDLDGFSHIWLVTWLCYARGWNDLVQPPRDHHKRGLFATRAPHRPNPIGISLVELRAVRKRVLRIGAHDLLDGTPVLDVKPYLHYADSVSGAKMGWVEGIEDAALPDHRTWQPAPRGRSEP
ncbi:MAG: tRNA (N6-threonylcarbamoyladenosine(37)-N6)-methyltransferase TrmO [Planctomycetes bacterium]|nr:tRNA (N6-threonylcarbamoyladenosine(37)-N6)-methyltransferase TrmO [Planctomycetota bacterium]